MLELTQDDKSCIPCYYVILVLKNTCFSSPEYAICYVDIVLCYKNVVSLYLATHLKYLEHQSSSFDPKCTLHANCNRDKSSNSLFFTNSNENHIHQRIINRNKQ
mmetsp:Transcript_12053/g.15203  ORF Transcript_12053/g.15203 Transcript_12053/m.15203 type:complete len:104 (+) Transcript_12053:582-893(+)